MKSKNTMILYIAILLTISCTISAAFVVPFSKRRIVSFHSKNNAENKVLYATESSSSSTKENNVITPSSEWELDCYSRPVIVDGKKLWEVLITDSCGSFRFCRALPSNSVNSRELRKLVEQEMDSAPVKPTIIRFFRGAMFNMINIALTDLDVICRPSRCTY